jgi:hypothetical protein
MLNHLGRPEARAREASELASLLAPYQGFDFGTFQLVEHDAVATPGLDEIFAFDDWPAPDIEWHFVLSSVLDTFIAAGLDEIDVQMYLRHHLGIETPSAREPWLDFAPALGTKPAGMFALPGFELVAFTLEIRGRRNIPPARRWLADAFIPQWLDPLLREASDLPRHFIELGFLDIRPR